MFPLVLIRGVGVEIGEVTLTGPAESFEDGLTMRAGLVVAFLVGGFRVEHLGIAVNKAEAKTGAHPRHHQDFPEAHPDRFVGCQHRAIMPLFRAEFNSEGERGKKVGQWFLELSATRYPL